MDYKIYLRYVRCGCAGVQILIKKKFLNISCGEILMLQLCDKLLSESLYCEAYCNILHLPPINNEPFITINCYEKCAHKRARAMHCV